MGSLFWDIVPHPWELVPDIVVSFSMVEKSLLFLWRATRQGMEKLNILERWHTFKFRDKFLNAALHYPLRCVHLDIGKISTWFNQYSVQEEAN